MGVNIEFTLYELKCTIHSILQHMDFYHTTENSCVKKRVNHKTKSCDCIIIHQDELYIVTSTLKEILHIVKKKYKIEIISNDYLATYGFLSYNRESMCHDESKSQNKILYMYIHQDESYIASNTLQQILHIVKEKYKIKINSNDYQGSNFLYDPGGTMNCLKQYMEIHNKLQINITYIKFHKVKHYIHDFIIHKKLHT